MIKWFYIDWWKYILEKPHRDQYDFHKYKIGFLVERFKIIKCRMRGHKCGVIWHNLYGYEPDMHCKNCGDNLG